MFEDKIITTATEEFKQKLRQALENLSMASLTPELAEQVSQGLQESIRSAALVGYRTFLESYDEKQDVLTVNGQILRFKIVSEKIFLTPFGEMTVPRHLYQADAGGSTYVPLDEKWGMTGEYAMPQVQECVLLAAAHLTPKEVASLLQKSSLFHPSATAITNSISFYGIGTDEKGEVKSRNAGLQSRYLARMPEERCPTFKAQFEAELDHVEKAIDPNVKKVLLNDGHRSIWNYLDQNERYQEYEKLVDFYHTSEHLSPAAEALFGKKSAAADDWYNKWYDPALRDLQKMMRPRAWCARSNTTRHNNRCPKAAATTSSRNKLSSDVTNIG